MSKEKYKYGRRTIITIRINDKQIEKLLKKKEAKQQNLKYICFYFIHDNVCSQLKIQR
jgi:hypothetical protein